MHHQCTSLSSVGVKSFEQSVAVWHSRQSADGGPDLSLALLRPSRLASALPQVVKNYNDVPFHSAEPPPCHFRDFGCPQLIQDILCPCSRCAILISAPQCNCSPTYEQTQTPPLLRPPSYPPQIYGTRGPWHTGRGSSSCGATSGAHPDAPRQPRLPDTPRRLSQRPPTATLNPHCSSCFLLPCEAVSLDRFS